MSDVECPYCGCEQDINHDDGYGYDESQTFEQECPECEKTFAFTTYIHFSYNVKAAPYLNKDKNHDCN
jgi:endogenous inhibitor of DNA gyrase (YacG/DUF329 family)